MANRFKKGDIVFFIDKSFPACQQYPRKGTVCEKMGVITRIVDSVVGVEWDSGLEYTYYEASIRHKHRVKVIFRYIFDVIKEQLQDFRSEIAVYRMYRRFKKGDIVCLKYSSPRISTCEIGRIVKKSYSMLTIQWENIDLGRSYELAGDVEHCTGIDPNKLFKSYKKGIS